MARNQMASTFLKSMNRTLNVIDTAKFSAHLRERGIQPSEKRVLVTNFRGSKQEKDFTVPANCNGFGRIHHFKRHQVAPWPDNPLPIEPAAKALELGDVDEV